MMDPVEAEVESVLGLDVALAAGEEQQAMKNRAR